MKTSSPMAVWSPAGQSPSRVGRRPRSTAFRKELAKPQSPKSSPRVERAGTPTSPQPSPNRTRDEASSFLAVWIAFCPGQKPLSSNLQVMRLRGPKESSTTSATSALLRVTPQSHSHGLILAPKHQCPIWTDCCLSLAQTTKLPKSP